MVVQLCKVFNHAYFLEFHFHPRSLTPDATICSPATSLEASMLYHGIRYPDLHSCPKACSAMKMNTINTAREKDWSDKQVVFNFWKKIPVSREVLSNTLHSLIAEVLPCFCTNPKVTRDRG